MAAVPTVSKSTGKANSAAVDGDPDRADYGVEFPTTQAAPHKANRLGGVLNRPFHGRGTEAPFSSTLVFPSTPIETSGAPFSTTATWDVLQSPPRNQIVLLNVGSSITAASMQDVMR